MPRLLSVLAEMAMKTARSQLYLKEVGEDTSRASSSPAEVGAVVAAVDCSRAASAAPLPAAIAMSAGIPGGAEN